jgi:hypothetical protein
MRKLTEKNCREYEYTHFLFNIFFSGNRAVYEIKWKDVLEAINGSMAHARFLLDI